VKRYQHATDVHTRATHVRTTILCTARFEESVSEFGPKAVGGLDANAFVVQAEFGGRISITRRAILHSGVRRSFEACSPWLDLGELSRPRRGLVGRVLDYAFRRPLDAAIGTSG
jgi:hypothetical protein